MRWENVTLKGALAFFLVLVAASMVFLWMLRPPTGLSGDAIALLASFVTMFIKMAADAIGYQYNSSSGSDKKDETQAKVADKLADKVATPVVPVIPDVTLDELARASLTAPELEHFNKLADEDAKKKFMALAPDQRAQAIQRGT